MRTYARASGGDPASLLPLRLAAARTQARIDSATASANKTQSELQDSRGSLAKNEVDLSRQHLTMRYLLRF